MSSETKPQHIFELGSDVFDKEGNSLGKVKARFSHYILVERGSLFVKAYYVPHSVVSNVVKDVIRLSLSENELKARGYDALPDDLYNESPEPVIPHVDGTPQFGHRPLSPAQTGHYNYGRKYPGINTDASGSYHREEVSPNPKKVVEEFSPER